jgi:hypothetical protein
MTNRNTLSQIVLTLSCIRVLTFFISFISIKLLGNELLNEFSNVLANLNTVIHITVMLFIAYALNAIKEGLWRSVGFILLASISALYTVLQLGKLMNVRLLGAIGILNMIIIIYFIIQSFLIKHEYFKNKFRIYSIVILLMVGFNMLIPLIFYKMALPMSTYRYTSLLSIFPAALECYIVYLFYRYFNFNQLYQNNDFTSNL